MSTAEKVKTNDALAGLLLEGKGSILSKSPAILPPVCPPYPREPWSERTDYVYAVCKYHSDLRDNPLYIAAKDKGDVAASEKLISEIVLKADGNGLLGLADDIAAQFTDSGLIDAKIIVAHPVVQYHCEAAADDPTVHFEPNQGQNVIPRSFAEYVARALSYIAPASVDTGIRQTQRVGRRSLDELQRFVFQAKFTGEVDTDAYYVLVDDNFTSGGTLAMLRSYIISKGGTVIGALALSNSTGRPMQFSLANFQETTLIKTYTADLREFWYGALGHDIAKLTYGEAKRLCDYGADFSSNAEVALKRLRDGIDEAAHRVPRPRD